MRQPQLSPKRLPTPTPTVVQWNPSADEFALWCDSPVTRWVAKAYSQAADAHGAAWKALLALDATPEELVKAHTEFRIRSDAYKAFLETTHADYLRRLDEKEWIETYGQK